MDYGFHIVGDELESSLQSILSEVCVYHYRSPPNISKQVSNYCVRKKTLYCINQVVLIVFDLMAYISLIILKQPSKGNWRKKNVRTKLQLSPYMLLYF